MKKTKKIEWETPKLVILGANNEAYGDCVDGSANLTCGSGGDADEGCGPGNQALAYCSSGTVAGDN